MSTIAQITINECDGCHKIACLRTAADYAAFEHNWYSGTVAHFCLDCRKRPSLQQAIREDQELLEVVADVMLDSVMEAQHAGCNRST